MKFNKVQLSSNWYETKDENFAFDLQSRCVCGLFARLVQEAKIQLPRGWGVYGEFGPEPTEPHVNFVNGLFMIRLADDIRGFDVHDEVEKKKNFLKQIMRLMEVLAAQEPIALSAFQAVADKAVSMNFVNSWEWKGGRKYSPNKKYRSKVLVRHETEYFELTMQLLGRDGTVLNETKLRPNKIPDEIIIDNMLGELIWISETEFEIVSRLRTPDLRRSVCPALNLHPFSRCPLSAPTAALFAQKAPKPPTGNARRVARPMPR